MRQIASGRPQPGEYAAYAVDDLAHVVGDDAVEALENSAAETLQLFGSISEERASGLTYAPGKWTVKEILGHLVDDERIMVYRALCIARTEPLELPGFDENRYVAATAFESRTIENLLAEFRAARASTIAFFASVRPEEWSRRGTSNGHSVTVRGLAFHIAGHELHHLRVVRERYLKA